jgi:hypothetical protein
MSDLQLSYEYIVTCYLTQLQHHHHKIIVRSDDGKNKNNLVTCMEQILLMGRFMELLLE